MAALGKRQTLVVDHNKLITELCNCNNACYYLSCGVSQQLALFYVMEYITKKDKLPKAVLAELKHSLKKQSGEGAISDAAAKKVMTIFSLCIWFLLCVGRMNHANNYSLS
jgi:hypothetical protein